MGLNAHRVFFGTSDSKSYLAELTVDGETEKALRSARDTIRQSLKDGFGNWTKFVRKQDLFEAAFRGNEPSALRPKFRMQGSFSYHTYNAPAQNPPQEIDLDDGMFVPVSFLSQNGSVHPAIASLGYFTAVESILAPVCRRAGWTLVTTKPSCVRVLVAADAHVDIALYAIPDNDFKTLVESELAKSSNTQDRAVNKHLLDEQIDLTDALYSGLRADRIMLAHRKEGWKESDPRKLEAWFRAAVARHGDQLRRVCRYVKGWRDYQWPKSRLASIALMAAVVTAYDEATAAAPDNNRDDRALLLVAKRLHAVLASAIKNPVVKGARLDEGWTSEERATFVAKAKEFLQELQISLETNDVDTTLTRLTVAFGDRIPRDRNLITADNPLETKSAVYSPAVLTEGLLKEMGEKASVRDAVKKDGDNRYA